MIRRLYCWMTGTREYKAVVTGQALGEPSIDYYENGKKAEIPPVLEVGKSVVETAKELAETIPLRVLRGKQTLEVKFKFK